MLIEHGRAAGPNDADETAERIEPDNIQQWAELLEVTEEQLESAIALVGSNADDVIRQLGNPDVI